MAQPFAKIFDTPHGQLLAYISTTDDADEDCIRVVGANVEGVRPQAVMSGYASADAVRAAFDKIDQALAELSAASLHAAVARFPSEQSR